MFHIYENGFLVQPLLKPFLCFPDQVKTEISDLFSLTFCFCSSREGSILTMVSDIMNVAISHKCRSITFSDGITSRKNYENLIVQIHNFIIENDTCNLKFIVFHADDINSVKIYKRILQKVEWKEIVLTNWYAIIVPVFVRPTYCAFNPNSESFAKVNALTTRLYKS